MKYQPIIGLEIHLQLNTKTKAFCNCPNESEAPPNINICPICVGHPGTLPLLNKAIIEKAILVGLALNCSIQSFSRFDRKHYFYPDLPKGYQISQYHFPICKNGYILLDNKEKIDLNRIHIEEDAGKLIHKDIGTYVDLNRAGVPLLEIVTEPVIKSSQSAYDFLTQLKLILDYLNISDCTMEKGSLRCDANISLMQKNNQFGPKVEIKNLNSFKNIQKALDFEIERQSQLMDNTIKVEEETRLYNSDTNETYGIRKKETSMNYKYFPDPDIAPISLDSTDIKKYTSLIPELPKAKRERYQTEYKLPLLDVSILTSSIDISTYFENTLKEDLSNSPKSVSNWIKGHVLSYLNEFNIKIKDFPISTKDLSFLIKNLNQKKINIQNAKMIFLNMLKGEKISDLLKKAESEAISKDDLYSIIKTCLEKNSNAVENYKKGKSQALYFITGQVMKETKGKANPSDIQTILLKEIKKL